MQFDNTLGAALLGAFFTCILYGITCLQCSSFLRGSAKSEQRLIYSVWALWFIDTVHVAFVMHAIYWYTVTHFTDAEVIGLIPWSIPAGILITPTSDTIVRCWFTYRVWIMSRNKKWLTFPLVFLVFVIFVIGLAFGIKGFTLPTFVKFAELAWLLYLGLGLLVFVDFYIAASLCFFLFRARSGFNQKTESLINMLLLYTINTGLFTSVSSLACFITYAAMPHNYVFLAMYFPLSKLYINAFLASLDGRDELRDKSAGIVSIPLSTIPRPVFLEVHDNNTQHSVHGSTTGNSSSDDDKYAGHV